MSINDINADLYERFAQLELEEGTPAYGITQQVIHMGYDSLTARQKSVYDKRVIPLLISLGRQHKINARTYNAPN